MSWTKNLSIILMINNKGQLWVSSIKKFLDRQGIYSVLLISLMGEANGLCTESYKCLIKKFNWSVNLIYIAITRDLTRETYASIKLLYQTFITLRTRTICLPHQTWQGIYSALLISFIVCLKISWQKTSKAGPCY